MTTEFVPPLFKDLGKRLQDLLFKKKFGVDKEFKVKSIADNGSLTFDSTISFAPPKKDADVGSGYHGNLKAKQILQGRGNLEVELNTNGSVKAAVELDQLRKGLVLKLSGGHQNKKALDELHAVLDAHYRQEFFSTTVSLDHIVGKTSFVTGAGMIGFEGLSVGGSVKADIAQPEKLDFSAGAEFSRPDYSVTLLCTTERAKTADGADKDGLEAMFIHRVTPDLEVGGSFQYDLSAPASAKKNPTVFTVGAQYAVERDITLKVKANSEGEVESAYETRLRSSNLTFAMSGKFDACVCNANPLKGFGFSILYGDS